jgi:hypothetical protein
MSFFFAGKTLCEYGKSYGSSRIMTTSKNSILIRENLNLKVYPLRNVEKEEKNCMKICMKIYSNYDLIMNEKGKFFS